MRVFFLPSLALVLSACAPGELECAFLDHPEQVDSAVVSLTGDDFTPADPFPTGPGEVLGTTQAWDAAVARWGTDGGLVPNFDTDLVFVYRWVDDGCVDPVRYAAWEEGDRLRVVAVEGGSPTCDPALPRVDLVLVAADGATDIAWCAGGGG